MCKLSFYREVILYLIADQLLRGREKNYVGFKKRVPLPYDGHKSQEDLGQPRMDELARKTNVRQRCCWCAILAELGSDFVFKQQSEQIPTIKWPSTSNSKQPSLHMSSVYMWILLPSLLTELIHLLYGNFCRFKKAIHRISVCKSDWLVDPEICSFSRVYENILQC